MYHKGIVIELLEEAAVILTQDQEFIKVVKKEGLEVGQTIFFLDEDILKSTAKVIPFYKKAAPILTVIAACLLLFMIPFSKTTPPYATLSIDVNPSFELELDEFMVITKVNALNQSAQALNVQSLEGLPLQEGLTQLKEILIQHDIPLDTNAMLFGLALSNQEDVAYENEVKESLKTANSTQEFAYLKITEEDLALAHEQAVSGAKLKVKQLLNDIDIDDLSINEIIQLFKENKIHFDLLFKDGIEIDDDLEDTLEDIIEDIEESDQKEEELDDDDFEDLDEETDDDSDDDDDDFDEDDKDEDDNDDDEND